jgi:hypothetical protein
MSKNLLLCFILLIYTLTACAQSGNDLLVRMMMRYPDKFQQILTSPDTYEVQIIYTQIDRDSLNQPHLRQYSYNLNPHAYFCPASLAKIPVVALALEKINALKNSGITKETRMGTGANFSCQKPIKGNNLKDALFPSVARYLEQILVVSDNEAYSRLYELLGQAEIHQKLRAKGYPHTRILRRFNECNTIENRHTNPIIFYDSTGKEIYTQPAQINPMPLHSPLGVGWQVVTHYDKQWKKFTETIDYNHENFAPLQEANDMLIALLLPEAVAQERRFQLTPEDYQFIRRSMGAYPREAQLNVYADHRQYFDTYKKYLYYGRGESAKANLRSYNVVGWWAGYVSDCAYFVDYDNKVEFFLSAVIFTSKNKTTDRDYVPYTQECFPFLANLGKLIYEYEKIRVKRYLPNFEDKKSNSFTKKDE